MIRIGVDVGGTKIEIAALDAAGAELLRRREPTPAGSYDATLALIATLIRDAEIELGERCTLGIGTPGALSPASESLRNSNSACLNGRPVRADLERLLGREIRLENDANCFALSEATDGAAAGAAVAFGVILGTGVGGGIVVGGRVLGGANAIAGEWGHNPLPWPTDEESPGGRCYCGRSGCIETWLSGPGLAADHERRTGAKLPALDIAADAARGEPAARRTLSRYVSRLARSLAAVINLLDPDVIVLGGGLSNVALLYDEVPRRWGEWIFSDTVRTRLVANRHGDSSGVRGAAVLGGISGEG